jgi:hypothetical protein
VTDEHKDSIAEPVSGISGHGSKRARGETIWYATLSIVLGIVFLGAVITAASVSPTFCLMCHGDAGESLSASVHVTADCDDCHTAPGALGLVESRMRVVSMVLATPFAVVAGADTTDVLVDNEKCLDCHEGMVNQTFSSNGLRMNHRAPEAAGWQCTTCHAGASHPGETYVGASYTMDQCLSCHSAGPTNLSTCEACHEEGSRDRSASPAVTPWRVTHGSNWQRTHGMGDLNTCKTCHAADYCVACHNMQLPHAANFLGRHGKDVLARPTGDADCVVCHKGAACENCHGVEMPHPDGFVTEHQQASRETPEVCARCHAQEQCDECHTRHTHPGIPLDQLRMLQQSPVSTR